jgi:hypothetical protein
MYDGLWITPPAQANREEQRQWLRGLARGRVMFVSESMEDYGELCNLRDGLWEIAATMEATDETPAVLAAIDAFCGAIDDAPVDAAGWRVLSQGRRSLRAARRRLEDAL